MTMKTSTVEIN